MNTISKLVLSICTLLFITGCAQTPTGQVVAAQQPVVIGVSTMLTGDLAVMGQNMVASAQIALDTIPHNTSVVLAVEDSGCVHGQGLTAATKLVEINHAVAIIGGTCSGDTLAAASYVNEKHVPYLTPVTGGKNIDEAGEYVFRIANSDILAGTMPADDLIRLGKKRIAIITDNADYTLDIHNTFVERFTANGGTIVFDEKVLSTEKDFRTTLLKVEESKPDAIVMLSQLGTSGLYFIRQADELGVKEPIVTTFVTIVNSKAREIAGDSLNGVLFYDATYAENSDAWHKFAQEYAAKYGKDPVIPFHSAATYDSMRMVLEAIDAVGADGAKIHDYILAHGTDKHGLLGDYNVDAQGNTNVGFTLKRWNNGAAIAVE